MSARGQHQARGKAAPLVAQNLDVQHFRAALEEAAEESRGWALRDLAGDSADVGACNMKCAEADTQRKQCQRKLDVARRALKALQKEVQDIRKRMTEAAQPSDKTNGMEHFLNEAEELLKGLPHDDWSGWKVGEAEPDDL